MTKLEPKIYLRRYHEFNCWMHPELFWWFLEYFSKYSYGESRSDKFRVLLCELQKFEERGITIANPKQYKIESAYADKPHLKISAYLICFRPNGTQLRQRMSTSQHDRQCFLCAQNVKY